METKIKILYFASIKEIIGIKEEILSLDKTEKISIRDLRQAVVSKYPDTQELILSCMFAIDGEYIFDHAEVLDYNFNEVEVAIIPPISGG